MIKDMLNKKTYIGNIEPNPKEFGIWIKEDGSHKMYDYNTHEWVCDCGGSGSDALYFAIGMDNIVATDFAPENLQTIFQYEEGMTFFDWLNSEYNNTFEIPESPDWGYMTFKGGASAILRDNGFTREVLMSEKIESTVYMLYGDY